MKYLKRALGTALISSILIPIGILAILLTVVLTPIGIWSVLKDTKF